MFIKCLLLLLTPSFLSAGHLPRVYPRIIDGIYTDIKEAPWQVSLQLNGEHQCGGSIYDNRTIITAAHCFFSNDNKEIDTHAFSVSVGSTSRFNGTVYGLEKKVHYPGFKVKEFYRNDIAVLRLSNPLVFGDNVQPISLATKEPVAGTIAAATGWGVVHLTFDIWGIGSFYPENLLGIRKRILTLETCQKWYWNNFGEDVLCTDPGVCNGDSGGPLVVNRELVGVMSGMQYLHCNGPAFFANVFHLRGWILSAIKALNSNN
ncbi:hypothetical protein KR059_005851 [Drosophila kikkawai]|nr:hypothetical protein KR059_005851 [Drosophila kikkawai]